VETGRILAIVEADPVADVTDDVATT
jgi:hypothetical protein